MKLLSILKGSSAHPPVTTAPDPQCTATTTKPGRPRCTLPKAVGSDKCAIHSKPKM